MSFYKKMREKHRPREINVLFIAESPPLPKIDQVPYFYNEEEDSPRRLYRRIAYALELRKPKSQGLQDFENRGMFLVDIFDEPLKKVKAENVEAHLNGSFEKSKRQTQTK